VTCRHLKSYPVFRVYVVVVLTASFAMQVIEAVR
jgi:hypothetical protein